MRHNIFFFVVLFFCALYFFEHRDLLKKEEKDDTIRRYFWNFFIKFLFGWIVALWGIYGLIKVNIIGIFQYEIHSNLEFRMKYIRMFCDFTLPLIIAPIILFRHSIKISESHSGESIFLNKIIYYLTLCKNILGFTFIIIGLFSFSYVYKLSSTEMVSKISIYSIILISIYTFTLLLSGTLFLLNFGSVIQNHDLLVREFGPHDDGDIRI